MLHAQQAFATPAQIEKEAATSHKYAEWLQKLPPAALNAILHGVDPGVAQKAHYKGAPLRTRISLAQS